MYYDRYDICEAWWLYLSTYHAGMGSSLYARLSRLQRAFSPRQSLHNESDLTPNGQAIYLNLLKG